MALVFVNTPVYNTTETIDINGVIVTMTGTTSQNATDDINIAAVPGVTATNNDGTIELSSSTTNILLAEGGGTALVDLGFTAGNNSLLANNLAQATIDINAASIPGIFANDVGGYLVLTSSVNNLTISGTGLVPFGLTGGTYNRVSTVTNAVTEIIAAAIADVSTANIGGAVNLSSNGVPSIDITLAEGSGTTLFDLGFTAGIHYRTSQASEALTDILNTPAVGIAGVTASVVSNALMLDATTTDLTLTEGSGTTLFDLGFTAGIYLRTATLNDVISDITSQTPSYIEAINDGGYIKITASGTTGTPIPTLKLDDGTPGTLANLGFLPIERDALPTPTNMDDISDFVRFFTELITDDIDYNTTDNPANPYQDLRRNDNILNANAALSAGEIFLPSLINSSVRTTAWGTAIIHEFSLTFANDDEARAFFNVGNKIRFSANRTGGSASAQNTAWDALLLAVPPDFVGDALGGGLGGLFGYFGLTASYQTFFTIEDTSGGPYDTQPAPIRWTIAAKTNAIGGINGGNGNMITFQMQFLDQHLPLGASPWPIGPDTVDGIFTSSVFEFKTNEIFEKPTPVYTLITDLTAGI